MKQHFIQWTGKEAQSTCFFPTIQSQFYLLIPAPSISLYPSCLWGPTHAGLIRLQDLFVFVGAIHYPGGWIFQDSVGVMLSFHFHLAITEVKGGKKGQMSKLKREEIKSLCAKQCPAMASTPKKVPVGLQGARWSKSVQQILLQASEDNLRSRFLFPKCLS